MNILDELIEKYPVLVSCKEDIEETVNCLIHCYENGGKLLVCGNGGSASDSEHIVGELMKGFLLCRPLTEEQKQQFRQNNPSVSDELLCQLQGALPAISLTGSPALSTAFANDVNPELMFAQQVMGLGKKGDVLIGISTSGNAKNVCAACEVARSKGMFVIALTGKDGGCLKKLADTAIVVPAQETYQIQELHLPVYHAICAMLEAHFFSC